MKPEDVVPRCVICYSVYTDGTQLCPKDDGQVKVFTRVPYVVPVVLKGPVFRGTGTGYEKAPLGIRFQAALLDGMILLGLSLPSVLFFLFGTEKARDYDPSAAFFYLLGFCFAWHR